MLDVGPKHVEWEHEGIVSTKSVTSGVLWKWTGPQGRAVTFTGSWAVQGAASSIDFHVLVKVWTVVRAMEQAEGCERQVLNKNTPIFLFLPLVSGVGLHVIKKWQHWSLLAWSSPLRILSCSGPDKCLLVYVCTHGSETRHRRAMLVAMHLPSSFSMRKMSEDPPWYFVVTWDYCI